MHLGTDAWDVAIAAASAAAIAAVAAAAIAVVAAVAAVAAASVVRVDDGGDEHRDRPTALLSLCCGGGYPAV